MLSVLFSLMVLSQTPDTAKPVITWKPEKPKWGQKVTLTYHHDAPNAVIKGKVPLYASVAEGVFIKQTGVFRYERRGDVSRVSFEVPDSTSQIIVYTFSMDDWVRYATAQIELTVPEGWRSIKEELASIRDEIFMASVGRGDKDRAGTLLDSLSANPIDEPYYYYVLTDGYMRLGHPDSAWAALSNIHENYQGTDEYAMALSAYDYSAYTDPRLTTPQRMDTLNRWIDEEIGKSLSENLLMCIIPRWEGDSTHLSLIERREILERFTDKNPADPYYRSFLAAHLVKAGDTAAAEEQYNWAISLLMDGTAARKIGGMYVNPDTRKRLLEKCIFERGRLRAGQKRFDEALGDFSFAILMKGDNLGKAYLEQAKVYQALDHYKLALDYFLKALGAGNIEAKTAAENLYLLLNNTREGFDEWLSDELVPDDNDYHMTTDFRFTDLEGKPGRWLDYRGKIVVVNVWGLGCGPCKKEIPELNELVASYEKKPVEFVALSGSDPQALKDYLAEHPFDYTNLILSQPGLGKALGFPGVLPWHCVVDPQGRVRFQRSGAREDNSDLKLVIDQLLQEQEDSQE